MIRTHVLGFPRMGEQRELKVALEKYWKGESSAAELETVASEIRARHWALQAGSGLHCVTVGDFSLYDHVANMIQVLGCEPSRFGFAKSNLSSLEKFFIMARGNARGGSDGLPALEMTKWFDTNYHYLVPEFDSTTKFSLASDLLVSQVKEAKALNHRVKVAVLGPISFLFLGKSKEAGFDRVKLLESLVPVYKALLVALKSSGAELVQLDEPILSLDLHESWKQAFAHGIRASLSDSEIPVLLATYFGQLQDNLSLVVHLPIAGLHVDAVRAPEELPVVARALPKHMILSVGIIDGRNIWRADLDAALKTLRGVLAERAGSELWLSASCSLLHVPFSLRHDATLDVEVQQWVAGAVEKLHELRVLSTALCDGEDKTASDFAEERDARHSRATSARVRNHAVSERLAQLSDEDDRRKSPFAVRQALQRARLQLPLLPTTTIGSFPQTAAIRTARASFRRGTLTEEQYNTAMESEIAFAVRKQEELGLDVLVHGEAERNDMVEYFGEQLSGFAFTANGWVQSYGSRCVKPPILFGDVTRPHPMTVKWAVFAQSLTQKPMKGMLTGPITILQWSFVRDDQPRSVTATQIALAIRDEVSDLEAAGISIVQIDEPAIREGLPLRRADWGVYLAWATRAFRLSSSSVRDYTQIHTHLCYSEFNDILPDIAALDADVISIETSRSDMELLRGFGDFKYPNEIGPGVYDIHSPRVPSKEEMVRLLIKAAEVLPKEHLWVNPDCGLKTRLWPETESALRHLVDAARAMRQQV